MFTGNFFKRLGLKFAMLKIDYKFNIYTLGGELLLVSGSQKDDLGVVITNGNYIKLPNGDYEVNVTPNLDTDIYRSNFSISLVDIKGGVINTYGINQEFNGCFYGRNLDGHDATGGSYTFVIKGGQDFAIKMTKETSTLGIVKVTGGQVLIKKL